MRRMPDNYNDNYNDSGSDHDDHDDHAGADDDDDDCTTLYWWRASWGWLVQGQKCRSWCQLDGGMCRYCENELPNRKRSHIFQR
jgi:hypothetical protein